MALAARYIPLGKHVQAIAGKRGLNTHQAHQHDPFLFPWISTKEFPAQNFSAKSCAKIACNSEQAHPCKTSPDSTVFD